MLDDGVMVCSQCGAVVGMTYGPGNAVRPSRHAAEVVAPTVARTAPAPPRALPSV
jgi:hypothetical protein